MSEEQDGRANRIARYKEQRRKELAAQFGAHSDPAVGCKRNGKDKDSNSSSSERPRTTRTSRLRAAANAQEICSSPPNPKLNLSEKLLAAPSNISDAAATVNRRFERDKSNKRKSNLNRSLNSEEVPNLETDDTKNRRRRRRFFPEDILNQAAEENAVKVDETQSDKNLTALFVTQSFTSPNTASPSTSRLTLRKSELSVHMENARKVIGLSNSEIAKSKSVIRRRSVVSSPKDSSKSNNIGNESDSSDRKSDKLSLRKSVTGKNKVSTVKVASKFDHDVVMHRKADRKMEELTALTRDTLAEVEKIATKKKDFSSNQVRRPASSSPVKQIDKNRMGNRAYESERLYQPFSILKKKISEETIIVESVPNTTPVSILKRKVSQDDPSKSEGTSSTHTPPVTFSPSVVEPATTNRRQGILKKRRSLDESQVMRHRSCSPDVASKLSDSRSILKNQRRSSLEELTRTESPELHLHGILKRKTSKAEDDDHSLNSPQGILKRKSGASSASSTGSTPHVSIATAVILAAAGGAEMILESEGVRPILKKKSFSEECSYAESVLSETPKPILKKKSSTDTDDCDERPKPILKSSKNSLERDSIEINTECRIFSNLRSHISSDNDCEVKPILKQNLSREEGLKPRLSFCEQRSAENEIIVKRKSAKRSHTICAEFNKKTDLWSKEDDREITRARPLSVSELVMNFETSTSQGAIPKRSSLKRSDRYRTQPITSNELEASLNSVRSPGLENILKLPKSSPLSSPISDYSVNSILDFTSSLENDSHLNSFLIHNTSPDSGVCGKMSSDSAFQSLGDGLELEQEEKSPDGGSRSRKLEPSGLELQMKVVAQEAMKLKLSKGNEGMQKYRNRKIYQTEKSTPNRFSTQPITYDEVQEAARLGKDSEESEGKVEADPSNLSLSERIKLFSVKVTENTPKLNYFRRFQTQPVTLTEVESARRIPPPTCALGDGSESKGILKCSFGNSRARGDSPSSHPKSVLKKRDSFDGSSDHENSTRRSILKNDLPDITFDEGISCNDSASDSETASAPYSVPTPEIKIDRSASSKKHFSSKINAVNSETSDGESSGGREVRSIFKNESKLKVKNALEVALSKSKSHTRLGHEIESPFRRGTSIRKSQTHTAMPRAIEEIQAKLQQSGESGWKKRVQQINNSSDELKLLNMNRYNDELSEKSILEIKKDELDAASKQWKSRVEESDAEKFSVLGRMEKNNDGANLSINIPSADKDKRTPSAKKFKGKEAFDSSSTPVSPEKNRFVELTRSYSVPQQDQDLSGSNNSLRVTGKKVAVFRPDDFTFTSFYKPLDAANKTDSLHICSEDFDLVTRQPLLVQKKNIQVQRRRAASRNPVKALASRSDILNEYVEVITGVAERERQRLNIEKLAKGSGLALTALAGLVSKEDFSSVALKKKTSFTSVAPYKDIMLLHIKGRQHVQTRLVEPVASSINDGDNYILVTPNTLYNYVGTYSNIIEQSRAATIINHIQQSKDLGCKDAEVVTLNASNISVMKSAVKKFWNTLGCEESENLTNAGHPEEDSIYESNILSTNMIYKLDGDELVPMDEYWGTIPKVEMLEPTQVIVFDFGSEMYVWSGKNAPLEKKRLAFRLAKEMWDLGYDYSECNICPLNVASILGNRSLSEAPKKSTSRPKWALFAKLTQHRETVLFTEKFLDWPDFTRVIRVKGDQSESKVSPSYNLKPCNINELLRKADSPDLIIEGLHLGRGDEHFDAETSRLFEFETLNVSAWRVLENQPEKLDDDSVGHFYNGDSYIVKWNYRTTVKGRELSGKPSKHLQAGRDRCVYFCWQGSNASINEKGSAALLTVELDSEKAPQIRVLDGTEPAAFVRLFKGGMVVHDGKRDSDENASDRRLFMVRGEMEEEVSLVEVSCKMGQLRSRACFLLFDLEASQITLWVGSKSSEQTKNVARQAAKKIIDRNDSEFCWTDPREVTSVEVNEGEESEEFLDAVGQNRSDYFSLKESELDYDYTMKLFNLNSISGTFSATEVLYPLRSEYSSPYPFLQTELYSASQPALFLIDNHHELWLWQGWWPERDEEAELSDQTGSGAVRWQAERKAAMQTVVNYWQKNHSGDEPIPAFSVWAGLEPLEFQNLFPHWIERGDVAALNLKDGKKPLTKLPVEQELALLLRTTYSLSELLQRPLPEGVDPTHLEIYLSADDFQELLSMTKEEFHKLPPWKQTAIKKEKGLF